ncbi:hypothetical protein ABS772_17975 [Methylorubrum podarium]|uniref:Uncharacterized protein n=1 Tax=Methylorubrum podarium TaxID=200476 RepID=A0ABV1QR95_9HYPH
MRIVERDTKRPLDTASSNRRDAHRRLPSSTEVLLDTDGDADSFQTLVILQGVDLTHQQGAGLIV